jgi:pantoate--beta-alanine ligase
VKVVTTAAESRALGGGIVGLVPTMGFLHEGHLALMNRARRDADTVVASVFVNPLQFGEGEDLKRYPRDLERDIDLADTAGVDVVFAPPVEEMYPTEPATRVTVGRLAEGLCGRHRPGHFDGVATVVAKLFAALRPDFAVFGKKDAQQLAVVRRMTRDLSFPVDIIGEPIVRESDGLALSSRNVFLAEAERTAALVLSRGLFLAADAAEAGERVGGALEAIVRTAIETENAAGPADIPFVALEYAELTSAIAVDRIEVLDRPAFLAVAAHVGETRLIDNVHFDAVLSELVPSGSPGPFVADRGIRLQRRSVLYGGS